MMLHQLGIQQAERETPAEAHISSVTNTSMRPCTLFYIETRQTLQVEVETKTPDVVAAFSVKHGTIVWISMKFESVACSLLLYPRSPKQVLGFGAWLGLTILGRTQMIFWTAGCHADIDNFQIIAFHVKIVIHSDSLSRVLLLAVIVNEGSRR